MNGDNFPKDVPEKEKVNFNAQPVTHHLLMSPKLSDHVVVANEIDGRRRFDNIRPLSMDPMEPSVSV